MFHYQGLIPILRKKESIFYSLTIQEFFALKSKIKIHMKHGNTIQKIPLEWQSVH